MSVYGRSLQCGLSYVLLGKILQRCPGSNPRKARNLRDDSVFRSVYFGRALELRSRRGCLSKCTARLVSSRFSPPGWKYWRPPQIVEGTLSEDAGHRPLYATTATQFHRRQIVWATGSLSHLDRLPGTLAGVFSQRSRWPSSLPPRCLQHRPKEWFLLPMLPRERRFWRGVPTSTARRTQPGTCLLRSGSIFPAGPMHVSEFSKDQSFCSTSLTFSLQVACKKNEMKAHKVLEAHNYAASDWVKHVGIRTLAAFEVNVKFHWTKL